MLRLKQRCSHSVPSTFRGTKLVKSYNKHIGVKAEMPTPCTRGTKLDEAA